jgi:hypothetical protein
MNVRAKLTIVLAADGSIGVEGPINEKMLCYGLLDCARDAIKDHNDKLVAQQKGNGIAIAKPGDVPDRGRDAHISFDAPLRRKM